MDVNNHHICEEWNGNAIDWVVLNMFIRSLQLSKIAGHNLLRMKLLEKMISDFPLHHAPVVVVVHYDVPQLYL